MKERVILVVGDRFAAFAAGKDAMTQQQLRGLLGLPAGLPMAGPRVVVAPGQGLGDDDVAEVLALAEASAQRGRFDLSLWKERAPRAPRRLAHKHHPANTLVSEPRRISEDGFVLDLMIDEACEIMADHQTGEHVQGMVLLEAARQAFLAVTEAFFLPQDGTKFYFVINAMSARYERFVFPVDALVRYTIREQDTDSPQRKRFAADIAVEQGGAVAAVFAVAFTVYEDARIAPKEAALAREALDRRLDELRRARADGPLPAVA